MTDSLEQAAIALAEQEAPGLLAELKAKYDDLMAKHAGLYAEVQHVHHFLTVFSDHLKTQGIDITSALPKVVTADDLAPVADATPTADANTPAAAGTPNPLVQQ